MGDSCLDHFRISDLLSRYAHGVDRGDVAAVLACFSDDALAEYDSGAIRLHGHEALERFFSGALTGPSTHLISNTVIELEGETARTSSSAIACLTRDANLVKVRGLVYETRCRRHFDSWQITKLMHRSTWQFAAPGGALGPFSPVGDPPARFKTGGTNVEET